MSIVDKSSAGLGVRQFHIDVAPGNALDAFHHPYAYAARRESLSRADRAGTTISNG